VEQRGREDSPDQPVAETVDRADEAIELTGAQADVEAATLEGGRQSLFGNPMRLR